MKNVIIFLVLLFQLSLVLASDQIYQLQERLQFQKKDFITQDLHDIESVKKLLLVMYNFDQKVRMLLIHDRTVSSQNIFALSPYEGTMEDLELCRQQVGLEPFEIYFKRLQEIYKK